MAQVTLYHNPRCSKSRATKALLEKKNIAFDTVEYLKYPLNRDQLERILNLLKMRPLELMRSGESVFKEANLGDEGVSDETRIQAILDNPILMERPIVVAGERAAIGRPPENVLQIL